MNKLGENDAADADSDPDDPEQLLNEWLGELNNLTGVSFRFFSALFMNFRY